MLSMLARQRMSLGDTFPQKYPFSWLVWEPGQWRAPTPDGTLVSRPTLLVPAGGALPPEAPQKGDALCFELPTQKVNDVLRVGRAPGNDLVVNDATISRSHLVLTSQKGGWAASAAGGAKSTAYNGVPLLASLMVTLRPNDRLRLGDVVLTYLDQAGISSRLEGVLHKLSGSR